MEINSTCKGSKEKYDRDRYTILNEVSEEKIIKAIEEVYEYD